MEAGNKWMLKTGACHIVEIAHWQQLNRSWWVLRCPSVCLDVTEERSKLSCCLSISRSTQRAAFTRVLCPVYSYHQLATLFYESASSDDAYQYIFMFQVIQIRH